MDHVPEFAVTDEGTLWVYGVLQPRRLPRGAARWESVEGLYPGGHIGEIIQAGWDIWLVGRGMSNKQPLRVRAGKTQVFDVPVRSLGDRRGIRRVDGKLYFNGKNCLFLVSPDTIDDPTRITTPFHIHTDDIREDSQGVLWVSGQEQVWSYRPRHVHPATLIAGGDSEVLEGSPLHLSLRGIERFVPMDRAHGYQFSWRFDGDPWSRFSAIPDNGIEAAANLASGAHRIEIRSRDEEWNIEPTPQRLHFVVVPPPIQQRSWFRYAVWALCCALMLLGMVAIERALALSSANAELKRDRDLLEQRVRERTAELVRASAAKGEFLANMSHEIRTPMNGVIGMAELTLDTELSQEQREYVSMMKTSADSLLTLLNDILDFSKIEAGKLDFDPVPFQLRDALGDTLNALGYRASQKGLELAFQVQPDVPDLVQGDAGRLRQIVLNLVGNAIKFTHHGEVLVTVSLEQALPESVLLHFAITDTGIGIAP
jgi:signal transduction histidine kinase